MGELKSVCRSHRSRTSVWVSPQAVAPSGVGYWFPAQGKQSKTEKLLRKLTGAPKKQGKKNSATVKQFKKVGQMVGNLTGGNKKLGGMAGARLARLLGHGDYVETNMGPETTAQSPIQHNSLMNNVPKMGTFDTKGGVRVAHREFIKDIFSTTVATFSNQSFIVNPGIAAVFPFLAQIASNYEMYKFHGLTFEFVSATSPFGATSLGTWIMAMEYNAAASPFTAKPQMENSDYAMSARLDSHGMYGIECEPLSAAQNYFYVRSPVNPVGIAGSPVNLVDFGLFQFAQVPGITAGSNMGELWVTYDVELIRPRLVADTSISTYKKKWQGFTALGVPDVAASYTVAAGALANVSLANTATQVVVVLPDAIAGQLYTIDATWTSNVSGLLAVAQDTVGFAYSVGLATSTIGLKQQSPSTTTVISANNLSLAFTQTFVVNLTGSQTITITPHPNAALGFPGVPTYPQGTFILAVNLISNTGV